MRILGLALLASSLVGCGARSPLDPLDRHPTAPVSDLDAGLTEPPRIDGGALDASTPLDAALPLDAFVPPDAPPPVVDGGPPGPVDPSPRVEVVSAGWRHSCALRAGRAFCWGSNVSGQLGDGTFDDRDAPVAVAHGGVFVEISAGMQHTCARTDGGEIWCWGNNLLGALGAPTGSSTRSARPVRVTGITGARGVSAAGQHTCAVLADRRAACWGHGAFGQLGHGDRSSSITPTGVVDLDRIEHIEAGWRHTCAVRDDGSIWCWGTNAEGQLGITHVSETSAPVRVPGVTAAIQVSAGTHHTCAITEDARTWCWGSRGPYGRAEGGFAPAMVPGLRSATQVGAGERGGFCVVREDGSLACSEVGSDAPVRFVAVEGARKYSSGFEHACIAIDDGSIACFGADDHGQLGDGLPRRSSTVPVTVAF